MDSFFKHTKWRKKLRKKWKYKNWFCEEKLAKIYTKQKQYNLAIETYRKLMLKFPKKSILFANQIDKIKQK